MTLTRPKTANIRTPRLLTRFRANTEGATAVEFALVALPFFALLFAIVQTSLVMFANQALQAMTTNASRRIMTGELQTSGLTGFKAELCATKALFDCDKMMIQVKGFTDFASADPSTFKNDACLELDDDGPPPECWSPGGPRDLVLVRVSYEWPFSINLADLSRKTMLVAVSAFRSEPY